MTKEYKEYSRAIKDLKKNAIKGNFESSFQLYQNYSKGKNVEQKNEILANEYLYEVENALAVKKLCLKSIFLSEFKRFRELELSFDENVTVIIGDNGAGKTSIVEAISKVLTWLNNNIEKEGVNGKPVNHLDINNNASTYAEISSKFQFDKMNTFDATLGRVVPGYIGDSPTSVTRIKQYGAMYRHTASNKSIMIPLLAFYSVERSDFKLTETVLDKASDDTKNNRFSGIKSALEGSGKLGDFSNNYIELANLSKSQNSKEVEDCKYQISIIQKTIDEVYGGSLLSDDNPLFRKLNAKKEELATLLKSISTKKYQEHLIFVNDAIEKLVPGVRNLEIDRSTGKTRLLVENLGDKVNISQLSQGQKMLIALVGDLVMRLVTLNPDASKPLDNHGIVVIDEIELHLHPKWQQDILIGLQNTFPNIQFIVTTHSPQVLSTVYSKCIRQIYLDENRDIKVKIPPFQTRGIRSSDVLEQIMDTFSVPKVPESKWITDYSALIQEGLWEKKDGVRIFKMLIEHFGEEHPEIMNLKGEIRLVEFKIKAANKFKKKV